MNSFSCLGGLSLKEYSLITRKWTQRGLALGMPRKGLFSTSRLSADMTSPLFKPVYPHHLLTTLKPEKMDEVKGVDSVITLSQPSLFEPAFDCLRQLLRLKARLTISQFICHVASFRHLQEQGQAQAARRDSAFGSILEHLIFLSAMHHTPPCLAVKEREEEKLSNFNNALDLWLNYC